MDLDQFEMDDMHDMVLQKFAPFDELKEARAGGLHVTVNARSNHNRRIAHLLRAARVEKSSQSMYAAEVEPEAVCIEGYLSTEHRRGIAKKQHAFQSHVYAEYDTSYKMTVYEERCSVGLMKDNYSDAYYDHTFGSNPSDSAFIDAHKRLLLSLHRSRATSLNLFHRLNSIKSSEEKEKLLMQCFIIDSMPTAIRPLVIQGFFPNGENFWSGGGSGHSIWERYPIVRTCLAYLSAVLCVLHFVGMVVWLILFDWVVVSSNVTLWAACLALSIGLYFIIIEPVVILLREVLVKQQLVGAEVADLCFALSKRALLILRRRSGLIRNAHSPIQHLNPACRAARSYPFLPISRLLISVNDSDIVKLPDCQQSSITSSWTKWAARMLHRAPLVIYTSVPHPIGELLYDLLVTCAAVALLVGFCFIGVASAAAAIGAACALVGYPVVREVYTALTVDSSYTHHHHSRSGKYSEKLDRSRGLWY